MALIRGNRFGLNSKQFMRGFQESRCEISHMRSLSEEHWILIGGNIEWMRANMDEEAKELIDLISIMAGLRHDSCHQEPQANRDSIRLSFPALQVWHNEVQVWHNEELIRNVRL